MLSLVVTAYLSVSTADHFAAVFTERGYIEVEDSAQVFDLSKDFTIELWARWQGERSCGVFGG